MLACKHFPLQVISLVPFHSFLQEMLIPKTPSSQSLGSLGNQSALTSEPQIPAFLLNEISTLYQHLVGLTQLPHWYQGFVGDLPYLSAGGSWWSISLQACAVHSSCKTSVPRQRGQRSMAAFVLEGNKVLQAKS